MLYQKVLKLHLLTIYLKLYPRFSYFFQFSEQRQLCFEKHISEFCPSSKSKKLRDPSRTRWVERIKDIDVLIELFEPLWSTLDEMRLNISKFHNNKTQSDAFSFFKAIDNFSFIVNLVLTYRFWNFHC